MIDGDTMNKQKATRKHLLGGKVRGWLTGNST